MWIFDERSGLRLTSRAGRAARKLHRNQAGMTLVEIMVVIAILGILMTVVGIAALNQLEKAKVGTTEVQIGNLESALLLYRVDHGKYPSSAEGLDALINPPPTKKGKTFPSYLEGDAVPTDQWGNPFLYYSPGSHGDNDYEIISLGSDGAEGGDKTDADIKSWELH